MLLYKYPFVKFKAKETVMTDRKINIGNEIELEDQVKISLQKLDLNLKGNWKAIKGFH
jgi:hypothetical protein